MRRWIGWSRCFLCGEAFNVYEGDEIVDNCPDCVENTTDSE